MSHFMELYRCTKALPNAMNKKVTNCVYFLKLRLCTFESCVVRSFIDLYKTGQSEYV